MDRPSLASRLRSLSREEGRLVADAASRGGLDAAESIRLRHLRAELDDCQDLLRAHDARGAAAPGAGRRSPRPRAGADD